MRGVEGIISTGVKQLEVGMFDSMVHSHHISVVLLSEYLHLTRDSF